MDFGGKVNKAKLKTRTRAQLLKKLRDLGLKASPSYYDKEGLVDLISCADDAYSGEQKRKIPRKRKAILAAPKKKKAPKKAPGTKRSPEELREIRLANLAKARAARKKGSKKKKEVIIEESSDESSEESEAPVKKPSKKKKSPEEIKAQRLANLQKAKDIKYSMKYGHLVRPGDFSGFDDSSDSESEFSDDSGEEFPVQYHDSYDGGKVKKLKKIKKLMAMRKKRKMKGGDILGTALSLLPLLI